MISGPQGSLGSPRQACGYKVPGPTSAWLPSPLATAAQVRHDTLRHDTLPKKLLFGQVKGLRPPGRPRSSFNDVALQDCQARGISRPYRDAQDRLLWKDKTCPART